MIETEVKISIPEGHKLDDKLKELGFKVGDCNVLQHNMIFDTADSKYKNRGELVRVRVNYVDGKKDNATALFTWKGKNTGTDGVNRREEEEWVVPTYFVSLMRIFDLQEVCEYYRIRVEYRDDANHVIAVDSFIKTYFMADERHFMELEGDEQWIRETVEKFGFSEKDFITTSYAEMFGY